MADNIEVQITGTINLKKALDEFKGSIQRRIIRPALKDVGEFFKTTIKEHCHFEHEYSKGAVLASIDYSQSTVSVNKQQGRVLIGPTLGTKHGNSPTTDPGIYSLWIEYGLKNPRVGGTRMGKKSKPGKAGEVPNYPAQPFMRPAFESGARQAIEVFTNRVMREIASRNSAFRDTAINETAARAARSND